MQPRTTIAIVILAAFTGFAAPLHGQTLADLAKKADDQKKGGKGTKTYTNKDVGDIPPATAPTVSATGASAAPAQDPSTAGAGTAAATDKPAETPATPGQAKDQAFYADKMKELKGKLDRDQAFYDALQSQINALTTDFVNRDDPAQRSKIEQNRNRSMAQQAQLQKDIAADKKAIADFEEQARKAGAPPGWLR